MPKENAKVIPTGITTLDEALEGGIPAGVFVVLLGEMGAGHEELAVTASMKLSAIKSGKLEKPERENTTIPEHIHWVTFTRPETDIVQKIRSSYDADLSEPFSEQVKFKDLSKDYFLTSSVPAEWVSEEEIKEKKKEEISDLGEALGELRGRAEAPPKKPRGMLDSLANYLTEKAKNSVVILDSLTDLARLYSDSEERWYEFVLFLRGLQRVTKKWNGIIYSIFDAGLLDEHMEAEISLCADGVLSFKWAEAGPAERRRTLNLEKFRGLLSSTGEGATRFDVNITSSAGLQVAKPELIEGL